MIPTKGSGYNYDVDCDNDGNLEATGVTGDYICGYTAPGDYTISISGTFPQLFFGGFNSDSEKVIDILQWGTQVWRSMASALPCRNMIISATDVPNLTQVTSMNSMFSGASSFNQDIGDWDVGNVTNMDLLFESANSFNQPISDWDVSNVTKMAFMLSTSSFNQPISDWDVSNVTDMTGMFNSASSFNQPISDWDVSNVTSMFVMFNGANSFNQPISDWDVSNVTSMFAMFDSASSFNQPISDWDVGNVTNMFSMLASTNLSTTHYDSILNSWSLLSVQPDVSLGAENIKYSAAGATARQRLIDEFNWSISDGGQL